MSEPRRVSHRPYLVASIPSLVAGGRLDATGRPRRIEDRDLDSIGALMSTAFRGTIDDEGETPAQLADQLRGAADGAWGVPIRESWLVVTDAEDRPISAIVTTRWWGTPFVAMIATDPRYRGRGIASGLIRRVAGQTADAGETVLALIVTRGNPALRLYTSLGFVEHDRPI